MREYQSGIARRTSCAPYSQRPEGLATVRRVAHDFTSLRLTAKGGSHAVTTREIVTSNSGEIAARQEAKRQAINRIAAHVQKIGEKGYLDGRTEVAMEKEGDELVLRFSGLDKTKLDQVFSTGQITDWFNRSGSETLIARVNMRSGEVDIHLPEDTFIFDGNIGRPVGSRRPSSLNVLRAPEILEELVVRIRGEKGKKPAQAFSPLENLHPEPTPVWSGESEPEAEPSTAYYYESEWARLERYRKLEKEVIANRRRSGAGTGPKSSAERRKLKSQKSNRKKRKK